MAPYKAVLSTLALLVTGLAHGQAVIISHPKVSTIGVNSDSYAMVEGPQGDVYGTYIDLNGQLFVTMCKTNCQKPEGWKWVKLAKDGTSENIARIQVDAKGGLHLLQLLGSTYSPLAARYWSCAADCAKPGSWKSTQLKHSQGPAEFNTSDYMLNHDWFTLDNQGRPRFMVVNGNAVFGGSDSGFGERVVYAACDQNCHTTSNWSFTPVAPASWSELFNGALRFDSQNRPHFLVPIENRLTYLTCTGNCTQASNWRSAVIPAPVTKYHKLSRGSDLAIAASGTLYVPFTFENDPGKTSQLWLYSCAQNCTTPASWKKVNLSQHSAFPKNTYDSGAEPAIKISGNKVILSFLASPGKGQGFKNLYAMSCTQNCAEAKGNWTSRLAYSSASEKLPDQGVYKYMYTLLENKAIMPSGRAAFLSVPHWGVLYTRMVEIPGQSVKEESAADGKWMPIPYFVK